MKKPNDVKDYSIKEFIEMELPENAKLVEKKLGDKYIGPFSKRLKRISVSYNAEFPELEPIFRKLDLILASGDKILVEAALRIDSISIENLMKNEAATSLINTKAKYVNKDNYLLSNDSDWETWPHEPDQFIAPGGEGDSTNARVGDVGNSGHAAFSQCHPTIANLHDIWIPEFESVFNHLDKLLVAAR